MYFINIIKLVNKTTNENYCIKFGGTSVGSIQRIKKVSNIIKSYSKKYRVIVLSSAMSGIPINKYVKKNQ